MTTIRDELRFVMDAVEIANPDHVDAICDSLGIDPDLPAEWATADRCLDWLRERDWRLFEAGERTDEYIVMFKRHGGHRTDDRRAEFGPTLHAAIVYLCRAVQEAQP